MISSIASRARGMRKAEDIQAHRKWKTSAVQLTSLTMGGRNSSCFCEALMCSSEHQGGLWASGSPISHLWFHEHVTHYTSQNVMTSIPSQIPEKKTICLGPEERTGRDGIDTVRQCFILYILTFHTPCVDADTEWPFIANSCTVLHQRFWSSFKQAKIPRKWHYLNCLLYNSMFCKLS